MCSVCQWHSPSRSLILFSLFRVQAAQRHISFHVAVDLFKPHRNILLYLRAGQGPSGHYEGHYQVIVTRDGGLFRNQSPLGLSLNYMADRLSQILGDRNSSPCSVPSSQSVDSVSTSTQRICSSATPAPCSATSVSSSSTTACASSSSHHSIPSSTAAASDASSTSLAPVPTTSTCVDIEVWELFGRLPASADAMVEKYKKRLN